MVGQWTVQLLAPLLPAANISMSSALAREKRDAAPKMWCRNLQLKAKFKSGLSYFNSMEELTD